MKENGYFSYNATEYNVTTTPIIHFSSTEKDIEIIAGWTSHG